MHYIITEGGEAPNVVPDKASVWYYLRNTDDMVEDMFKRVIDCARGAAMASGTALDTILVLTATHQKHSSKGMAETIRRNIELIGLPEWSENENQFARALQKNLGSKETGYPLKITSWHAPSGFQVGGASTDVGEVSLTAPTATLNFPGIVPGTLGHHWSTVTSGFGTAAWKGLNTGAKVMASSAIDLLTNSQLLEKIKSEFEEYIKAHPYKSFLPEGARPPLTLNKDLMDKYRNAMSLVNQASE
jgi:aminobenzoyl-glutamate utilization protein B